MRFDRYYPFLDQLVTSGGNFLTIALCARVLSIEEQGKVGFLFIAYVAIVMIGSVSIYQHASIQAPRLSSSQNKLYFACLLMICILLVFGMALLLVIVAPFIAELVSWNIISVEVAYLVAYLALQQMADFLRRTSYIFKASSNALLISSITYLPRIILLVVLSLHSFVDVLHILIISSLPAAGVFVYEVFIHKSYLCTGVRLYGRRHIKSSCWLILSGPLTWLWAYIPVFVLGRIEGLSSVAVLASVRSVSNVGNTLMEVLETSIAAKAGVRQAIHPGAMKTFLKAVSRFGFLLWGVGLLFLLFLGKEVILLTIGRQYSEFHSLLLLLWCVVGVTFMFRVHGLKVRTEGRSAIVTAGFAVSTISVIVASPFYVAQYGVYGVAVTLIIGASINLFSQLVISKWWVRAIT